MENRFWVRLAAVIGSWAALFAVVYWPSPTVRAQSAGPVFNCPIAAQTATRTCQAAPGAGKKLVVTDIILMNNVGTAQTLKLATAVSGADCATTPADLTEPIQFGAAVGNFALALHTPIYVPANQQLCVTPSAGTSYSARLLGYIE